MRSKLKGLPALRTPIGVALLSLYSIVIFCFVIWCNNVRLSFHQNSAEHSLSATSSSLPEGKDKFDDCLGATINTSDRTLSEHGGVDWSVYRSFISKNVHTPREVETLSNSARDDIASEVGLPFHVAARLFKLCHSYVNSFNRCRYRLLSDSGPCPKDSSTNVVIAVHSLPASVRKRMDIRARLIQFRISGYKLLFVLGRSESVPTEVNIHKENAAYGDIVWADFFEDYDNLTIKTLVTLRWMEQNCLSARYLVKADDDVYLKMTNLAAALTAHANQTRIIMGAIANDKGPFRDVQQKWYMPTYMFSGSRYPPFAYGPSYVISTDLIVDLNKAALQVSYVHLEDIFIALCANTLADVRHIHLPSYISDDCSFSQGVAYHGLICPEIK